MGEPYHEGPETTLEVQKIVEGVYTTIPQFNERTPTAILFKTKLKIFFFFLAIILLGGCDKGTDFGPFVRTTYSYPDGTTTTETLEFVAGSDAVVKLSLKGLTIKQLKVDGIVAPSDTVIFFYNITKDHEIFVTLKEKSLAPTLTVTVVKDSIPYGGTANFSWIAEGEITFVNLDYNVVSNPGSFTTPVLYASKEYTLVASGPGGSVTKKIFIFVAQAIAPTLTVTVIKDSIPYGGTATFSWVAEGEITSISLNDSVVSKTGLYTTPILYASREYTLVASGPGGSVTQKVTILVGNWETSNFGLITHDYFLLKEIRYIQDGGAYNFILTEREKTDKYYYSINYKLTMHDVNGNISGPFDWSFIDNTHIKLADQIFIFVLDKKFLTLRKESIYNNKPAIYEQTYWRPWLE